MWFRNCCYRFNAGLKVLCYSGRMTEAVELLFTTRYPVGASCYALLLQECIFRMEYKRGKRVHAHMIISGFPSDEYLQTKLLILYAKSADLDTALMIFNQLDHRSTIPWNALISGYVRKGMSGSGLHLYHRMRESGFFPDQFTFSTVFRACSSTASIEEGMKGHAVMIKCRAEENVIVRSALMDMYFKCSRPDEGHRVFNACSVKNTVIWTSIISGYGHLGKHREALKLFDEMVLEGVSPNPVTFLVVLCGCRHRGLIDEGLRYFSSMVTDYGITPSRTHYGVIVDLLGCAGRLDEAYEMVKKAPCTQQSSVIWGTLLRSSREHGDADLARIAALKYLELEPESPEKYALLSSSYATFGMWGEVASVRRVMNDLGMRKVASYSRIEPFLLHGNGTP